MHKIHQFIVLVLHFSQLFNQLLLPLRLQMRYFFHFFGLRVFVRLYLVQSMKKALVFLARSHEIQMKLVALLEDTAHFETKSCG